MQKRPGNHIDSWRLGPNYLFTEATLQLIRHLSNDPDMNVGMKIWFGGLGVQRAIVFFLGHYPYVYPTVVGAKYIICMEYFQTMKQCGAMPISLL